MNEREQLDAGPTATGRNWTRLEHYLDLGKLRRRAAARNRRRQRPRTEPVEPLFTLGTLPFGLLMVAMGVLAVLIMIAAMPGKPRPKRVAPPAQAPAEQITWFEARPR